MAKSGVIAGRLKKKGGGAAAKSKASAARGKTLKQRAGQKLQENLKDLQEPQLYVQVHAASGLTCEEMVMRDLQQTDEGKVTIKLGKLYYAGLRTMYDRADIIFQPQCWTCRCFSCGRSPPAGSLLQLQQLQQQQ